MSDVEKGTPASSLPNINITEFGQVRDQKVSSCKQESKLVE